MSWGEPQRPWSEVNTAPLIPQRRPAIMSWVKPYNNACRADETTPTAMPAPTRADVPAEDRVRGFIRSLMIDSDAKSRKPASRDGRARHAIKRSRVKRRNKKKAQSRRGR